MSTTPLLRVFAPREIQPGETRAPLVPATVARLAKLGVQIEVESNIGGAIFHTDDQYREAGAAISTDRRASLGGADMVLRLHKPPMDEVAGAVTVTLKVALDECDAESGRHHHIPHSGRAVGW